MKFCQKIVKLIPEINDKPCKSSLLISIQIFLKELPSDIFVYINNPREKTYGKGDNSYRSLMEYLNKSWKPECVLSFNMDWRILVFYPEPDILFESENESKTKIIN